jgi:hypothetical protein
MIERHLRPDHPSRDAADAKPAKDFFSSLHLGMRVQPCTTLTKTIRDVHESARSVNRIKDAESERLLMAGKQREALPARRRPA